MEGRLRLNATDGMVPSDMALRTSEGLEEERRVFYVAMTRARKGLHVYDPCDITTGPAVE